MFKRKILEKNLGFKLFKIVQAKNPLYATAAGR